MAPISKTARKLIEKLVGNIFERAKVRLLGRKAAKGKSLAFSFIPEFTLEGLFTAGSKEEGASSVDEDLLNGLLSISESYLDAHKAKAQAQAVHAVQTFIQDSENKKVDVAVELNERLTTVLDKIGSDVKRLVETETTTFRNMGIDSGIQRISAMQGVSDPTVFFVVVRDNNVCSECVRLHLLPDGVTPRVWKRSEIGAGYHKKGDSNPKISGLHPNDRCVLSVLTPGFGFNSSGMVVWKNVNWNELAEQRK